MGPEQQTSERALACSRCVHRFPEDAMKACQSDRPPEIRQPQSLCVVSHFYSSLDRHHCMIAIIRPLVARDEYDPSKYAQWPPVISSLIAHRSFGTQRHHHDAISIRRMDIVGVCHESSYAKWHSFSRLYHLPCQRAPISSACRLHNNLILMRNRQPRGVGTRYVQKGLWVI